MKMLAVKASLLKESLRLITIINIFIQNKALCDSLCTSLLVKRNRSLEKMSSVLHTRPPIKTELNIHGRKVSLQNTRKEALHPQHTNGDEMYENKTTAFNFFFLPSLWNDGKHAKQDHIIKAAQSERDG